MSPVAPQDLSDAEYALLAELPPEGSKLGYHNIGVTVVGLLPKFRESIGDSNAISGRLRSLYSKGMAANVELHDAVLGWQITPLGASYVSAWRASSSKNGPPTTGSEE